MRKLIWYSLGAVFFWTMIFAGSMGLFAYAFGYLPTGLAPVKLPGFKTYHSKKLAIEFGYPEILKVQEKNGVLTIEHNTPFEHRDPCDGSGLHPKSNNVLDFYIEITVLHLTPTELFLQEVMQFNEAGTVLEPKNTVRVTYGELDGFRIYSGSHGCGSYSYFFQLSDEKVLRVNRWPAPEFKEVPESEKQMYSRLRQIILPEQEEHIFREILSSLVVGAK